jgi:hypothetical protein
LALKATMTFPVTDHDIGGTSGHAPPDRKTRQGIFEIVA